MEVGSVINTVQPQTTAPPPTRQQTPKMDIAMENQHANHQQDVLEKMKGNPSYTPSVSEEAVIKAIEAANKKIQGGPREFEFSIHEQTKQIMVKIIDSESKEIVREIPPEKILDMVANMCEMAGLFVDEKR